VLVTLVVALSSDLVDLMFASGAVFELFYVHEASKMRWAQVIFSGLIGTDHVLVVSCW